MRTLTPAERLSSHTRLAHRRPTLGLKARGRKEILRKSSAETFAPIPLRKLRMKHHAVAHRIPRTLIKSGIKPKTALMSIGGGLWSPYSELIQTMVENCNKRVYYSSTKPIEHNVADIK